MGESKGLHPFRGLIALIVLAGCAPAAVPAGDSALAERLTAIASRFAEAHHLPGLAFGVLDRGQVLASGGFGTTGQSPDRPVGPETIFHMASVTKPFVATAVMQLVVEGKVDLDQPVTAYLPYFHLNDPRAAGITVRQVLSHTAGLPDVTDYRWDHPEYDDGALERWVRGLADSSLIAAPGERMQYSNIGFEVLADLIAKVSGQPFETYIQTRILRPVGMGKSTLLMTDVDSTLLALGHRRDSAGGFRPAPNYPYNRRHAASSTLHSNVSDMLRWARVNLGRGTAGGATILPAGAYDVLWHVERDITDALAERARRSGVTSPFDRMGVGLSWFLPVRSGRRLVWHSGADDGFRSDLVLAPDDSAAVVVMTNSDGANPRDLGLALLDSLLAARRP